MSARVLPFTRRFSDREANRKCIGKQTASGARLGPRGGGGRTRIQVAVAKKKSLKMFLSIFFLSPVAGQVVDVGASRAGEAALL